MRLVIDMQGTQTNSRFRGIGRFTLAWVKALIRNRGEHEIYLALNGAFGETIDSIRAEFKGLLPRENLRVWSGPGPVRPVDPTNFRRLKTAEYIREAFLASLQPDIIVLPSLFEGWVEEAVVSIGVFDRETPVAVVVHDLLPLSMPEDEVRTNFEFKKYYQRKLKHLRRAAHLLAVSEYSRQEAIRLLPFDPVATTTISEACASSFRPLELTEQERLTTMAKAGLSRPFVMYIGSPDKRKNLPRLIEAYAALPVEVRSRHQLLFCGELATEFARQFRREAESRGLSRDDFVISGYLEDEDVIRLYNSCRLFVFPSLAEGFGLPPLEAMACGAPVIASNRTSVPEVVGYEEALFNPDSTEAIRDKMLAALSDEEFRQRLIREGLKRAALFSWDESARRAWAALEALPLPGRIETPAPLVLENKALFSEPPQNILVIKLDHLGDFLLTIPALSRLRAKYPQAKIDLIIGSWNLEAARALNYFRRIYTFNYYKPKSEDQPKVCQQELEQLISDLQYYDLAIDFRRHCDARFLLGMVPAEIKAAYASFDSRLDSQIDILLPSEPDIPFKLSNLNRVHISRQMLALVDALPQESNDYITLPPLVEPQTPQTGHIAIFPQAGNPVRNWPQDRYRELVKKLIREDSIQTITIYFVSTEDQVFFNDLSGGKVVFQTGLPYQKLLHSLSENELCITNNSGGGHMASYLGLTVISLYGGQVAIEEWAPPFSASSYVIHRGAACAPCGMDEPLRCRHGHYCLNDLTVDFVLEAAIKALESLRTRGRDRPALRAIPADVDKLIDQVVQAIGASPGLVSSPDESLAVAQCLAQNIPPSNRKPRLMLDISVLRRVDSGTGIQRVSRSHLKYMLENPPAGYEVIPVYYDLGTRQYYQAARFARKFLGQPPAANDFDPQLDYYAGDIYFSLDLNLEYVDLYGPHLREMRRAGISVKFMVHDLLCLRMPNIFEPHFIQAFEAWLRMVAEFDGAVCVSRATADDLAEWIRENTPQRAASFAIDWSHNGADIENSCPTVGLPDEARVVFARLKEAPSFLSVSTIEPRKGYAQTLAAFNLLWEKGTDVNLVIVGRQGWMVDEIVGRLNSHPELNKKLFWLQGISDEYLEKLYQAASGLVAPSEGEGFGLSLVEAAQHKLPIIARDLAVFREVAGEHAYYFSGLEPDNLARAIEEWLELYETGRHPKSDSLPWQTWAESARKILKILCPPTGSDER